MMDGDIIHYKGTIVMSTTSVAEQLSINAICVGSTLPNWEALKQLTMSEVGACTTFDFFSTPNLGLFYVFYEDMSDSEVDAINHLPYLCGINGTEAAVVDLRFPDVNLILTTCINTKKSTVSVQHDASLPFQFVIVGIEANTGVVKAMRMSVLPKMVSANLNSVAEKQMTLSDATIDKLHTNFLWLNPLHLPISNMPYTKLGF